MKTRQPVDVLCPIKGAKSSETSREMSKEYQFLPVFRIGVFLWQEPSGNSPPPLAAAPGYSPVWQGDLQIKYESVQAQISWPRS